MHANPSIARLICPVLVGRDDLLALAERRLEEARRGRGGLLFLAGEAGVGKTRLLGAVERRAAATGFSVARGIAFPRDLEVTGGVLIDLSRALARTAAHGTAGAALGARLEATVDAAPSVEDLHRRRRILVLDVVDQLISLAGGGPVMLSLEDLHWADDLSLEILAALARQLPELPIQVTASYRSDELYPAVPMREWRARLLAGRLAEEARVTRLDRAGTAMMATLILGSPLPAPADLVASVHERSDGVPLHVEELLAVVRAADAGGVAATTVPDTLEEAILRRAGRLSRRARVAADAAAVIGRSFDVDLLGAVMGRPPDALAGPLAELERTFLVTRSADAGRLDFRHALIRDALYAQLPEPTRRRLHGRVADATDGDPRFGPAFRSIHLEMAGRAAEAHRAALEGGRRAAAVSAHREAFELLDRARRTMPPDLPPTEQARVHAELGDEAAAIDDNETADRWYDAATALFRSAGDDGAAAALAPRHVAVRHLLGDDLETRAARLTDAIATLQRLPDDRDTRTVRARLLAGLSAAHMLDRRLEAAIAYGESSRTLAAETGDTAVALDVAATLGACLVFAGRMDEGWPLLEQAIEQARAAEREAEAARAYRMLGSCASVLVEYDRAEPWLAEGIGYAERAELWNHRHYMAAHLAHVRWATGAWGDAEQLAAHALSDGRAGITTRITALHVLGYLALGRGDQPRAVEILDEARGLGEEMAELQRLSPALWGLAETALLAGDAAGAIQWCERGEAASAPVADAAYLFPFLVTGTRAYLAVGDPGGATAWVERVSAGIVRRDIPGTRPAIEHARGLLLLANGRTGRARVSLEAARAGWLDRRRMWEGAWATLDLATALARGKRPADARRLAADVAGLAESLGSRPLEEAATALDLRLRARVPADPAWAPLSARELEVAGHIADGWTNAQIAAALGVSPRTVTSHVEHILVKLDATRRAEVAAWFVRTAAAATPHGGRPTAAGTAHEPPKAGQERGVG
jgi:DNA-binding CsgD family transcriptional regulator/tetratricopeptide (TPR) repeat protein